MVLNGYENGNTKPNGQNSSDIKPTYALEHLATFKIKNEAEIRRPKEKLKTLVELDKTGGVWPMKMYMCFSGQWLVMLDSDMKEIENFPGALITEPTAFISEDPMEIYNNILIFTVPGITLGTAEMHVFQVSDVSAVDMVEDLRTLSKGKMVTVDRNKTPIKLPKADKSMQPVRDQYGIAHAAAEVAAEKNAQDQEQIAKDIKVLNHCFEDIERFVVRLQYAVEALRELELRKNEHNSHGEGLLITRSRPPTENEFTDILAKHKLAFNYVTKLENHFQDPSEPIHNSFVSLQTIVNVCNDVYVGAKIVENVVNPLLRRETVTFLNSHLNDNELDFLKSLGPNWTQSKDQFKNHKGAYHPTFYDEWSPDWVVDEEVAYIPSSTGYTQSTNGSASPGLGYNATWLTRLQSRNVKIAEVIYNKVASNDKELNVTKGEHLEIIDDSRNWWKARNAAGNIGYVPHTILSPMNFDQHSTYAGRDTDSLSSSVLEHDHQQNGNNRNTLSTYVPPSERETQSQQPSPARTSIPRSYSMPNVPIPPPMPPPSDPNTPSGTLKRNMAVTGTMAAMRARNDFETDDEALMLQSTINDELKFTLMQREKRKDLEILKTPQIYINQNSSPKEVEEWLRGKGFSDVIIKKLRGLNGAELFALSPHDIEGYFGQKESRRLISQIVLQKNICEYKTIRSSELSAKLARARLKADNKDCDPNEVF
ncbi:epidermal growth factor receptor kinase substrate 8 [Lucilia sericata]|uniref:epidermal growth factor receptor kinase substrate 8 n=1 Tax=Lucilia sericata TaxID=13632 RepID=UPI0018A86599|nr:epidermal growth factor receptor kinase substrate 8 [Lucilia sericata]XP_037828553.1 epidermal growth factor receptor kinase substrate 8 [Lucilia sericata]